MRTATLCRAHCHTLPRALPHTAALPHIAAPPNTHCRTVIHYQAHCSTATHALLHCHILLSAQPHTAARTACTHYRAHCHTLSHAAKRTAAHSRVRCCTLPHTAALPHAAARTAIRYQVSHHCRQSGVGLKPLLIVRSRLQTKVDNREMDILTSTQRLGIS
jgi:hypothetical protein